MIRAGDYGFRVPQLQLSQRALLFADLFGCVPRSRTADTYHGYPLITLNDPPVDVEVFLLALFDANSLTTYPRSLFQTRDRTGSTQAYSK